MTDIEACPNMASFENCGNDPSDPTYKGCVEKIFRSLSAKGLATLDAKGLVNYPFPLHEGDNTKS